MQHYGVFGYTGVTIAILAIVSVLTIVATYYLYYELGSALGVLTQLIAIVTLALVCITMWSVGSAAIVFWGVILALVGLVFWVGLPIQAAMDEL